jgi:hypothetical protein
MKNNKDLEELEVEVISLREKISRYSDRFSTYEEIVLENHIELILLLIEDLRTN